MELVLFARKFWFIYIKTLFPYERLRTRTRFETEAKGKLEIHAEVKRSGGGGKVKYVMMAPRILCVRRGSLHPLQNAR